MVISLFFAYLYFYGGRPECFTVKVFAIISTYLKTSYFVTTQTNLSDELAAVFLLLGLGLFSFSEEKKELPVYNYFRIKALIYAVYGTITLWSIFFLFFFGWSIFIASSLVFIFYLLLYLLIFKTLLFVNRLKR